jgi:hypothetical protein
MAAAWITVFRFPSRAMDFSLLRTVRVSPSLLSFENRRLVLRGLKRTGLEAEPNAEDNYTWINTATPPYVFMP